MAHPSATDPSTWGDDRYRDRRMFVKICGITNEDDALLAVAMGADAVGFVFAPSPRQIAPQKAADIVKRLPAEIVTVGVFRDAPRQQVVDIAHRTKLRAVQLHGHETAADSHWVHQRVPLVIMAFPAGDPRLDRAASPRKRIGPGQADRPRSPRNEGDDGST